MAFFPKAKEIVQDVLNQIHDLVPDWLLWLWSIPLVAWVFLLVGVTLGFLAGKNGWAWAGIATVAMITLWFLARATV